MRREAASGDTPTGQAIPEYRARSPFVAAMRRLLGKRIALLAMALILAFYTIALLAPLVAPHGFNDQNLRESLQGPSWEHPMGTDRLGRDMLSRVIWSARTTAIVTGAVLLTGGLVLGVGLGLVSGYFGGKVDTAIMRVGDVFFALPGLLIMILLTATVRPRFIEWARDFESWSGWDGFVRSGAPDYILVFGALSLFSWVGAARLIRSQVLALRETDYVMAARAMGAPGRAIIWRHLLPNVSNLVIVGLSAAMGGIVGSEIALSWLGVGVQPPHASFGGLIREWSGISNLRTHPYLLLFPAMIAASLIFAWNLLGDALNDVLSPRRGR